MKNKAQHGEKLRPSIWTEPKQFAPRNNTGTYAAMAVLQLLFVVSAIGAVLSVLALLWITLAFLGWLL